MKTKYSFVLAIGVAGMLFATPSSRASTDSDKSINDKIFQAMLSDRSLARGAGNLMVTTANGVVTLNGDIRSEQDKEKLHKTIAGTPGVKQVNDSQVFFQSERAASFGTDRPAGRIAPRQGFAPASGGYMGP